MEREGELIFGRGRAELLAAIESTGSISAAADRLGMSYRHAWSMLRTSEERMGRPLVQRTRGGVGGGGARITDYARALLERFQSVEAEFANLARKKEPELQALLD